MLKTICAFANDYHNLNGGYVVLGVEERDGRAVLPPSGLTAEEVEAAQKWIRGQCSRLDPSYQPIQPRRFEPHRSNSKNGACEIKVAHMNPGCQSAAGKRP